MLLKKVNSFILCLSLLGSLAGQAVTGVGSISSSKNRVVCSKNKKIKDVKKTKISAPQKSQKRSPLKEDLQKFLSKHWEWLLVPPFVVTTAACGYKLKKYLGKQPNLVKNKVKITNPKKEEEKSKVKNEELSLDVKTKGPDVLDNQDAVNSNVTDATKDSSVIKREAKVDSQEKDKCASDKDFWTKDRPFLRSLSYGLDRYLLLYIIAKKYDKDNKTYEEVRDFFNNKEPESFGWLKIYNGICRLNFVSNLLVAFACVVIKICRNSNLVWDFEKLGLCCSIVSLFSPTIGKLMCFVSGITLGCLKAKSVAEKVAVSIAGSLFGLITGSGAPLLLAAA